jgi:hypothetical protein
MDPLRLNLTEDCNVCKKSVARWSLLVQFNFPRGSSRENVLFCPVCDRMTPEDLEVSDMRTITLPAPTSQVTGQTAPYQLTFNGATEYRTSMGPERPFKQRDSKTMRRRYKMDGTEFLPEEPA